MSNFFNKTALQLRQRDYKIGDTNFITMEKFIEAKHKEVSEEKKGLVFYSNLIHAMPVVGEWMADTKKGEIPSYNENTFTKVLDYCKIKLDEIATQPPAKTESWKVLIKIELHDHLSIIESKIEDKIRQWKQNEMKIERAAFCQLLFDRKYFVAGSTNRVTVNIFAQSKYGFDIMDHLQSKYNGDRNKHKTLLNKLFK